MKNHLTIVAFILAFSSMAAAAQSTPTQPTVTVRENLVTALNDAVNGLDATFSFTNSDLYLLDVVGNMCEVTNPLEIEFEYPSGEDYFILRRKMSSGGTLTGDLSHELVEDLNNWLNTIWAMELTDLNMIGWECDNEGQRYYTQTTTDADAIEQLKILSGEQAMLDKYYVINGISYKGSDLLHFVPPSTTRHIRYMTDLGDSLDSDIDNRRMLSEAYLEILCPDTSGVPQSAFTFSFLVQTISYGMADCSNFQSSSNRLEISVNALVQCLDAGFFTGTTDEKNEALWNAYVGKQGMWKSSTNPLRFGGTPGVPEMGLFSIDSIGELNFEHYYGDFCDYDLYSICHILNVEYDDEYCEIALCNNGEFGLDPDYKTLIYTPLDPETCGGCSPQPVPCIVFCDDAIPELPEVTNVIHADARTFSDRSELTDPALFSLFDFSTIDVPLWLNPGTIAYDNKNSFEAGYRGKWRPVKEYVYRSSIKPGTGLFSDNSSPSTERNYNDAGVFDLTLFSWEKPELNDPTAWLNTSTVTQYSQNGESVEEADIFDIPSTAHFGYAQQLPTLVAKNADFEEVGFLSFEDGTHTLEAGESPIVLGPAHSGRYSFLVPSDDWSDPLFFDYPLGPTPLMGKILIRFWVKQTYDPGAGQAEGECPVSLQFDKSGTPLVEVSYPDITFIAQTGAWSLYEAVLDQYTVSMGGADIYDLRVKNVIPELDVWLDDIRIQPYRSEMICYVFDPDNFRQAALFDDQHFGVFYQYNAEGKLVRQIRETERGIKTVQETQYHTPLVERGDASPSSIGISPNVPTGVGAFNEEWASSLQDGSPEVDMLNLEFGLDHHNLKVFGMEEDELKDKIDDLKKIFEHPSIKNLELPFQEKLSMIEEFARLDSDLKNQTRLETDGNMSEAARASIRSTRQETTRRRLEIMNRLGLSESEARDLANNVRKIKAEGKSNSETNPPEN